MNPILKTKYTSSTEFVLAQVRGNNHWRTSQVRLEILNDRTLILGYTTSSQHLSGTQFFWYNFSGFEVEHMYNSYTKYNLGTQSGSPPYQHPLRAPWNTPGFSNFNKISYRIHLFRF
jgi:hypothetical protein